ncbi:MAG TPA: acyl carrier protein [Solirubrobacteraceae bacterium]
MSGSTSHPTDLTPLQQELYEFVASELASGQSLDSITADDDLIKRGIVDSLGVQQLVDFCQSRYGIRVADADLVPTNFQTLRQLADYVERKRGEGGSPGRLKLRSRDR